MAVALVFGGTEAPCLFLGFVWLELVWFDLVLLGLSCLSSYFFSLLFWFVLRCCVVFCSAMFIFICCVDWIRCVPFRFVLLSPLNFSLRAGSLPPGGGNEVYRGGVSRSRCGPNHQGPGGGEEDWSFSLSLTKLKLQTVDDTAYFCCNSVGGFVVWMVQQCLLMSCASFPPPAEINIYYVDRTDPTEYLPL